MKCGIVFTLFTLLIIPLAAVESPVWIIGREGLSRANFDLQNGKLSAPELAAKFAGGSWVVEHPSKPMLYASNAGAKGTQGIVAYAIDSNQELKRWDEIVLPAGNPSHIELDETGTLLVGSHWGGEAVSFLSLNPDGSFAKASLITQKVELAGPGPHQVQSQARPHWADFSTDGRFCFMVDLGSDRIWTYRVSRHPLKIEVHDSLKMPAGFGPRHLDFTADKKLAVVSGELSSQIASLRFHADEGRFEIIAVRDSLAATDHEPANNTSEIKVQRNGRFAFIGNRGHDSIGVFAIDPKSGALSPVEREAVRGIWPRNFNLDPSGKWLIVCGQYSNSLTVFAIDQDTGELTFNRQIQTVQSPTRIMFGR